MKQRAFALGRTRPLLMPLAVTLIIFVTLTMGAEGGVAQEGTAWELGDFCVDDYQPGSNCTANDVAIQGVTPTLTEVCTLVGDTATAQFLFQFQSNATTRYDIGLFIATDGTQPNDATQTGGAKYGDACYHDFLQPASEAAPWNLTGGYGPFKSVDGDNCAEIIQADGINSYYTQVPVTITCVDANDDGVVDPISICTSYDNNAGGTCATVQDAYPSLKSKCYCQTAAPDPPVLIYQGYDWGDLPDGYGTYTGSNGARHAIQDPTNTGTPQTQGGVPAVWLGTTVDYSPSAETDGQPNPSATGDDNNDTNDEDGVLLPAGTWYWGTDGGQLSVTVNSSDGTCIGCQLGFWIDWNDNGIFEVGESYVEDVDYGTQTVMFDIPAGTGLTNAYARFRLYAGNYPGAISSTGLVTNGEVEDYYLAVPLAVDLVSFMAERAESSIILRWKTASEIDNLGFNLYRAGSIEGSRIKLNAALIPSQAPGSPVGGSYEFVDAAVQPGAQYYYWLEDVNLYGRATLHGPVTARLGSWDIRLPIIVK